jgi:hypothetical protein
MGDNAQMVPISSTPTDAVISIKDESGTEIFKGNTPTTVTLAKSTGLYWGKKSYTVTITKDGHESQIIPITASANGYYMFGNLLFGGLIGWFIVDPTSGKMYTLSPEQVNSSLGSKLSHNNTAKDGSISIMLLKDVPVALREKMTAIN